MHLLACPAGFVVLVPSVQAVGFLAFTAVMAYSPCISLSEVARFPTSVPAVLGLFYQHSG